MFIFLKTMCKSSFQSTGGSFDSAAVVPSSSSYTNLLNRNSLLSLLVLALLFFLLCSSMYLVYRVHSLQLQVWETILIV